MEKKPDSRAQYADDLKMRGFNVHETNIVASRMPTYSRRDFYKVSLTTSHLIIHYANKSIEMDGAILFFGNPHIPYSIELLSPSQTGYGCIFTEEFLKASDRSESLQLSPLFKIGGTPVIAVNDDQKLFISSLFKQMMIEQDTGYVFKGEVVRNYVQLIIHEALKMQPANNFIENKTGSSRIASLFLELLERQFPIENPASPLMMRTPQDFAQNLSIHVNHLNRSVKDITGKPTSKHIADRIINEAKALLQYTDWTVAEISHALGFEYSTYFNNYFKRITNTSPNSLRGSIV
jgi:AraC family transcriptional activator of pobA